MLRPENILHHAFSHFNNQSWKSCYLVFFHNWVSMALSLLKNLLRISVAWALRPLPMMMMYRHWVWVVINQNFKFFSLCSYKRLFTFEVHYILHRVKLCFTTMLHLPWWFVYVLDFSLVEDILLFLVSPDAFVCYYSWYFFRHSW